MLAVLAAASLVFLPSAPVLAGEPADLRLEVRQGNLASQSGGQPATLVFAVTNDGPSDADAFNANVVIPFGDRGTYLASSSPSCNQVSGPTVLACPVEGLEVGQSAVFTLVIGAPPAGSLQPTDALNATGQISIDAGGDDPNGANDSSQFTLNLTGAPPSVTQISGTVADTQTTQPIVGASVVARDVNGATCLSTTDSTGAFNCTPGQPLAGGQITIEATMAGYRVSRTTVTPQNGTITGVQLALDPAAASPSPTPSAAPSSPAAASSPAPQAIKADDSGFPWDTVLVVLGIVLALGGLGALGWWMYKRKDKDPDGPGGPDGTRPLPDLVAAESIMPTMPMRVPNSVLSETTVANQPPFGQPERPEVPAGAATAVWGVPAPNGNWVNRSTEPIQVSGAPGNWSGGDSGRGSSSGERTAEWPTVDPGPSETDAPASGVPASGAPASGVPAAAGLVAGGAVSGVPASGMPASGVPASGIPASGVPASGVPASGVPASGMPASGRAVAPSDPTTAWPAMGDPDWSTAPYQRPAGPLSEQYASALPAEAPGVPSGPPAVGSNHEQPWGTPGRPAYGNAPLAEAPLAGWDTPPAASPMSAPPMPMSAPPLPMSAPPAAGYPAGVGYPGAIGYSGGVASVQAGQSPAAPEPMQQTAQWPAPNYPASAPPAPGYPASAPGHPVAQSGYPVPEPGYPAFAPSHPASAPPAPGYPASSPPASGYPSSAPPLGAHAASASSASASYPASAPPAAGFPASAPPAPPAGSAPPAGYGPAPQAGYGEAPQGGYGHAPQAGYGPASQAGYGGYPASAPPMGSYPPAPSAPQSGPPHSGPPHSGPPQWAPPPPAPGYPGYSAQGYPPPAHLGAAPMSSPPAGQAGSYPGAGYPSSAPPAAPASGFPYGSYPPPQPGQAPPPPNSPAPNPPGAVPPASEQPSPEWSGQQHWPPSPR